MASPPALEAAREAYRERDLARVLVELDAARDTLDQWSLDDRSRWWELRGDVLFQSGQHLAGRDAVRRARELVETKATPAAERASFLRMWEARYGCVGGDTEAAPALLGASLALLADDTTLTRQGELHSVLALCALVAEDRGAALRHARQAERAYARGEVRSPSRTNNLALLAQQCFRQGLAVEAVRFGELALASLREEGRADSALYIETLVHHGFALLDADRLSEGLEVHREVLRWQLAREVPDVDSLVGAWANLGKALAALGSYAGGRAALEQAVTLCSAEPQPPQVCGATWRLQAELLMIMGEREEVLEAVERGLALTRDGSERWTLLDLRATTLYALGRTDELREAVAEVAAVPLEDDPVDEVARMLALSLYARVDGDFERALALAEEALALAERSLAEDHRQRVAAARELADLLVLLGRLDEARPWAKEALRHRAATAAATVEHDSARAARETLVKVGQEARILITTGTEETAEEDLTELLRWAGAQRRVALEQARARRADGRGQALAAELAAVRSTLTELAFSAAPVDPLDLARAELEITRDRLQRELAALDDQDSEPPRPAALRAVLPGDGALVHFVRVGSIYSHERLVAFVLRPDGPVRRIELGEETDVALARYADRLRGGRDPVSVDRLGEAVRAAVYDPLRPALNGVRRVWVVPTVELAPLSWAGLPDGDGGYLVEHHVFATLDTAAELMWSHPAAGRELLLVGAPAFGGDGRRELFGCAEVALPPLPGTLREVEAIRRRWRRARVLTGEHATEEAVVDALGEAPRRLHVASHGFQVGEACAERLGSQYFGRVLFEAPLTLTGLALAGAAVSQPGSAGLWTGEEIASLDLGPTELVVLSACDTATGQQRETLSVQGLRYAFALAGVEQQVLALWPVEDGVAARLMARFYHHLRRRDAALALALAQREVLEALREERGHGWPQAWAAFVTLGPAGRRDQRTLRSR